MVTILGLDVSSRSTGWAVLKNGRFYKNEDNYGKILLEKQELGVRLYNFRQKLKELLEKVNPDAVIIEDVFSGPSPGTSKLLARFSGVAVELCYEILKAEPTVALATTVRKKLNVKGKEEAFNFIKKRYKLDWDFKKMNDVSDALLLALYQYKLVKELK